MEAKILNHVEQTEFLKEVARREVSRLLANSDVRQMLDNPQRFVDELLAAILLSLSDRLAAMAAEARDFAAAAGLARLSAREVAAVEEESEDRFLILASAALFTALLAVDAQLQRALAAGVSATTLNASLASEATREALLAGFEATARSASATFFQELDRGIVDAAVQATNDGSVLLGEETLFEWLAVNDSHTCDDQIENSCLPRHNVVMTLDQWDEMGRPGSPQLICSIFAKGGGSYCRCQLVESGMIGSGDQINPVDVTDAIRNAKERAALVYS